MPVLHGQYASSRPMFEIATGVRRKTRARCRRAGTKRDFRHVLSLPSDFSCRDIRNKRTQAETGRNLISHTVNVFPMLRQVVIGTCGWMDEAESPASPFHLRHAVFVYGICTTCCIWKA